MIPADLILHTVYMSGFVLLCSFLFLSLISSILSNIPSGCQPPTSLLPFLCFQQVKVRSPTVLGQCPLSTLALD